MKTLYALVCLIFVSISLNAQVGIGTNTPDASSMLEVNSSTKGFLPPRVSLTATSSASPITSPATGLVVYNTATVSDVVPGIYYWNGTAWKKLDVDTRSSQLTTSGSDIYYNSGSLGIGTTSPDASSLLEVKSTNKGFLPPRVSLTATSSASPITSPATGLVVYNTATVSDVVPGIYYWNGTAWKKLDVDTRSSQFTTSGSNVYYTTGNVGIGTTTPATTLDVNGSATVSGSLNGGNSASSTISGFVANFSTKTTGYTLVAADNGKILNFTNSTAVTLTIPSGLPTGFNCTIVQNGTGQITLAASSTTINNRNGFTKTAGQYSMVSILHLGSNVFISSGEMSN